jgi:hypothetical protein
MLTMTTKQNSLKIIKSWHCRWCWVIRSWQSSKSVKYKISYGMYLEHIPYDNNANYEH